MIESRYRHGKSSKEYHIACDKSCTIFDRYEFASSQGISKALERFAFYCFWICILRAPSGRGKEKICMG